MKRSVSVWTAMLLAVSLALPSLAADEPESVTSTDAGGTTSSVVELTAEPAPMSFYVPFDTIVPQEESAEEGRFPDVLSGDWFHESVYYCAGHKLMNGYDDGLFHPGDPISRAMLMQILWNYDGNPTVGSVALGREDSREWYASAMRWAITNGIVLGYGNGGYGAKDDMTREQLVTILWRYTKLKRQRVAGEASGLTGYEDASLISDYARSAMAWACGVGLIVGTSETTVSPRSGATRAEMAEIIARYLAMYGGETG